MTMELGIFARTFKRADLNGVLDAICARGIGAVQFNMACAGLPSMPQELGDATCSDIRQALAGRGLNMVGVSGTFNAIDPDVEARKEMTLRCRRLIERCRDLGTDLVTLCTGSRDPRDKWKWHPENAAPEAWRDLMATLEQLLPAAEACDVTLGIEPETANVIDSAAKARRLLDEIGSRNLKIVMDGANLFRPETVPQMKPVLQEAFDLLGPDIVSLHAKDITSDETKTRQPAGTGLLDFDTYFMLSRRIGYDGPVILHNLDESEVDSSAAFVRSRAAKWYSAFGEAAAVS